MRFYCKACADVGEVRYKTRVLAYIESNDAIVYFCRQCHREVELVDKPCEHEWVSPFQFPDEPGCETVVFGHHRKCAKCGLKQTGTKTITWRDWEWHGPKSVNDA